jgi:protein-tyrosine phosphatase
VLYVCTANRCRSPFAEHTLRRALAAAGIDTVTVASAGLLPGGAPVPRVGLVVARERGLPLAGHLSRPLADLEFPLETVDLVLAMERAHARELVADHGAPFARVFTLKQFDRWSATHAFAGARLGEWLDDAADGRSPAELLGASAADDTADPINRPAPAWRTMADAFEQHARAVAQWLAPLRGHDASSSSTPAS